MFKDLDNEIPNKMPIIPLGFQCYIPKSMGMRRKEYLYILCQ